MIFESIKNSLGCDYTSQMITMDCTRVCFLTMKQPFRILFLNVRTINPDTQPGHVVGLIKTLQSYKVGIAALSEARYMGFEHMYVDTYEVFYSGKERRLEAGIANA